MIARTHSQLVEGLRLRLGLTTLAVLHHQLALRGTIQSKSCQNFCHTGTASTKLSQILLTIAATNYFRNICELAKIADICQFIHPVRVLLSPPFCLAIFLRDELLQPQQQTRNPRVVRILEERALIDRKSVV